MTLRFGSARHGWLPTTLSVESRDLVFDISHVPYDFPSELVAALSGVLAAPGEYVARVNEEPTEYDWRFQSVAGSVATFEVVRYASGHRTEEEAEVVSTVDAAPLDIALPLWRGLRELASRARDEAFGVHWNEPFPFEALDRLTARVKQVQATPP